MVLARTSSASQIQAYLFCPLKYRFQYVDQIPKPWRASALAFKLPVHAAVEWFHKERLAGRQPTLTEILKVFDADWYAQNLEPLVFSGTESKDSQFESAHERRNDVDEQ